MKQQNSNETITSSSASRPDAAPPEHDFTFAEQLRQNFINTVTTAIVDPESGGKTQRFRCRGCGQKLDVSTLEPFSEFECPVCGATLTAPQWFGEYMLVKIEGTGGMATVYRATDPTLDREVAIKILSPEFAHSRNYRRLFLNEARTAATITHPAVIPIYTCGEFRGQPFIVMQFMKGGAMSRQLTAEGKTPPLPEAVKWFRAVADGLYCAYRHGIVHHDVKPDNIMLDNVRSAKIGDFGIAQAINDHLEPELHTLGQTWFSPLYVSPEKAVAHREDYPGDIYSLAASFYHIFTGHPPFRHHDAKELIRMRLEKMPPPPRHYRHDLPEDLSRLLMRMLSINPLERPEYPQIISELDAIIARLEQRRKQQSSRKARSLRALMKIGAATGIIMIAAAIAAGGYHLAHWKNFSDPETTAAILDQRITAIAALLAGGDSRRAADMAKTLLETDDLPLSTRKDAALQLAISNYLNNNRYAPDNCAYIAGQLLQAGMPPTSTAIAIIRFLEKRDIEADDLRRKLRDAALRERRLGEFAIFVRHAYHYERGRESAATVSAALAAMRELARETPDDDDYTVGWWQRLPLYDDVLHRLSRDNIPLEPLFDRLRLEPARNLTGPAEPTGRNHEIDR
ncbi:MAG: serine/threonine-protein kinase [Victivallales bacterium]|nr:serine/threonine-protein kinase [Victivallales bacterium]